VKKKKHTGLYDTRNRPICYGQIVHWTDGGDELDLELRIKTRWDRIAVVELCEYGIVPTFRVIDSPSITQRKYPSTFNFGSFVYRDTENYLTIVADSEKEYFEKFENAGECMKFVLEMKKAG
jgi:hypothetical protein